MPKEVVYGKSRWGKEAVKVAGQLAAKLAVNYLLGEYELRLRNSVDGHLAAYAVESCRPVGRQLGRQLSLREIWRYDEKCSCRPTGRQLSGQALEMFRNCCRISSSIWL
jgi:hypothetical protein